MTAPHVLVYCPLAPVGTRIYDRTYQSIMDLHWYAPLDIVWGRQDMEKHPGDYGGKHNLMEKYRQARRLALSGGYDALLTVESDMIIPRLTLERLTRLDADIAYGLYCSRHMNHPWLAFSEIDDNFVGETFSNDPDLCLAAWGNAVDSYGIGMGCTLIWRRVLERIDFRCPDMAVANDWFLALDAKEAGFRQVHDCGVVCGHIDNSTPADPVIYWPLPDGGYREEAWHTSPALSLKVTKI